MLKTSYVRGQNQLFRVRLRHRSLCRVKNGNLKNTLFLPNRFRGDIMGRESQPIRTGHSVNVNHVAGPDRAKRPTRGSAADQGVRRHNTYPQHLFTNVKLFLRNLRSMSAQIVSSPFDDFLKELYTMKSRILLSGLALPGEHRDLEFRREAVNLFNHFDPGSPNTAIGGPGVATITSGNNGRELLLALKLHYSAGVIAGRPSIPSGTAYAFPRDPLKIGALLRRKRVRDRDRRLGPYPVAVVRTNVGDRSTARPSGLRSNKAA